MGQPDEIFCATEGLSRGALQPSHRGPQQHDTKTLPSSIAENALEGLTLEEQIELLTLVGNTVITGVLNDGSEALKLSLWVAIEKLEAQSTSA